MSSRNLREALVNTSERRTDIEDYSYLQPMPNNEHLIFDHCRGIPIKASSAAGGTTFSPGSGVTIAQRQGSQEKVIVGRPPPGRRGVSIFARYDPPETTFDLVDIISADPDEIAPGATVNTSLFGGPFVEDPIDLFDAVKWDSVTQTWIADSEVTLGAPTWISDSEVTLDVSVDNAALAGKQISIRVRRA